MKRSVVVIDASAALCILRSEPAVAAVLEALERAARAGAAVVAPSVFWLEVANVLRTAYGRRSGDVLEAVYELEALGVRAVETDRPILLLAVDLAERYGLTVYDAAYLAVAEATDGRLLSLDGDLRAAAGDRAVSLGTSVAEHPAPYEREVSWPRWSKASAYLAELRVRTLAGAKGVSR